MRRQADRLSACLASGGHPAVAIHRTPWARVSFDREQALGCDGELVGRVGAEPLEFVVVPRALRVVGGQPQR